jgi:hypothetical protein
VRETDVIELTAKDLELLTDANYATFTTLHEDGLPQSTIIWIDAADGHVLVNTAKGRVKDRNVRRDPRVAVLVVREGDAYDWISIYALSNRYDGHGYSFTPGQVREILKIRPDRIIRYED